MENGCNSQEKTGNNEDKKNIDYKQFLTELQNLFSELMNKYRTEKSENLEYSTIENFKNKYQNINTDNSGVSTFKNDLITILFKNYFEYKQENNLELYYNLFIDILEILFKLYFQSEFKCDNNDDNNINEENFYKKFNIFDEYISPYKIFLLIGLNINGFLENRIFSELLDSKNVDFSHEKILFYLYEAKEFSYFNLILDLFLLDMLSYCDMKLLSIYIQNLSSKGVSSSIVAFKIVLFNILIYSNMHHNIKVFNLILSNIMKVIMNEAESTSRKMNEMLYDEKFNDFDFNIDNPVRKINIEEHKFLLNNFFPLLIYLLKIMMMKNNSALKIKSERMKILYEAFSKKDFINDNIKNIYISNFDSPFVLKKIYDFLEFKLDQEDIYNANDNEKNFNLEKNKILDDEINASYYILSFICDMIEFIYSRFHFLPESFSFSQEISININPFISYNLHNTPKFCEKFYHLILSYFQNSITNITNFIKFYITQQEIKTKFMEKINKLIEKSENIYNIYEPLNHLGVNIIIWICWKIQKNEEIYFEDKKYNNLFEKKIFNLAYSKIKIFDTILPVCSYLIKRSQNYKYMGFEILFDTLQFLDENSISDLKMLKNYSYEDIYKDLLEFIGGPDPQQKRTKISKMFNKLLFILSDEMKKNLLLYILRENLRENVPINDQMNAFIIHCLRNLLNDFINENLKKSQVDKILKSGLFEEKFLKEIISLTITTKLFVIDTFEIIGQGINFIQFCLLKDKLIFEGKLKIYYNPYLVSVEKELEKILYFIQKWNSASDEDKMKQIKVDTSDFNNLPSHRLSAKREELQNSFNQRKNQGLITQNLIHHINDFIFKCKKELDVKTKM